MEKILWFHIGRGGRFNNQGHRSYCGEKTISEVLSYKGDNSKYWNFINYENYREIYDLLKRRDLYNLMELFEKCRDADDFSIFEEKTALQMGELIYTDSNGYELISVADAEIGVGSLNWDNDYDTDICQYLSDCDEEDLKCIINSYEWNKEDIIQEYFNKHTELNIDWKKFNENYYELIEEYFNTIDFDIEEFYQENLEDSE